MNNLDSLDKPDGQACVYYDGSCPICSREIAALQHKATDLTFKNIHALEDLSENHKKELLENLNIVTANGERLKGLEANLYMWQAAGYGFIVTLLSLPIIKPIGCWIYDKWAIRRYNKLYGQSH